MATLLENTARIATAKENIRQSIISKGVEVSDDLKIEDYSSKIDLIKQGIEEGTYNIEVYVRIDNALVGEGVEFNVVGTDGTKTAATSRAGGYVFLTLSYGVGYDMQPAEEAAYYAESHPLIYHLKDEGNYFATDYYFTTAQSGGGGGEDVYSTNGYKLLYYSGQVDSSTAEESAPLIEYLQSYAIDHLINITNASSLCAQAYLTKNNLIKILSKDFSKCKTLNSAFDQMILVDENHRKSYNTNGGTLDISMDLSSCTNMSGTFNGFIATNSHYITQFNFDFNGTTSKVTDFGRTFRGYMSSNLNGPKYIKNINMDKCTGCSDIFYIESGSGDEKLKQLTFKGSFGGLSTTSSLTLKLPGAYNQTYKYTYEAFMETLNSVSKNTNGKTRIFSVPAVIYNQLTEDDISIAIEKGYTISSY